MERLLVDVYRNLHKSCWSIRSVKSGLVVQRDTHALLTDATFRVQKGGQQRVRLEKKKNVHAFVRGELGWTPEFERVFIWRKVMYNPYQFDTFVDAETHEPVLSAKYVKFVDREVWYV